MQAVILAAGKSTRTYPLTLTKPKPLLKAANKTLLEHNLDGLNGIVNEALIVVGYKKDLIKKYFGSRYKNIKLRYAGQKKQMGTGNALLAAEKYIKNDFISLHGDDIYSKEDFRNILKNKYAVLVKKVKNPGNFGIVIQNNGVLTNLIEKPEIFISDLANTGLYKLDRKIFGVIKKLKKSKRGEYELTDAIRDLSKKEKIHCVKSKQWLPIGYPSNLLKADKILRKNKNVIGRNSKISGKVKNSSIGDNCIVKGDVKNSIVMDNAVIDRNSLAENSIIGENVHLNGRAFNAIIADKSIIMNSNLVKCKIWPNRSISGKTITQDVN